MKDEKLVIFDMDGTIIDNEWAHHVAKTSIVAELGDNCTIDYLYFIGRDNRLFWAEVLKNMGIEGDIEYLVAQQYKRVAEEVAKAKQPEAPGLTTLLKYVKEKCDICVANIISDVIIANCASLMEHIVAGGRLICSGIVKDRTEEVRSALEAAGYEILEERHRGEWTAFLSRRN